MTALEQFCTTCRGDGTLPIYGEHDGKKLRIGVRVCPACNGACFAQAPVTSNGRLTLAERAAGLAEKMRKGESPFIGLGFMQEVAAALRSLPETSVRSDAVFEDMETAAHAFFNTGQHRVAGHAHVQAVHQFAKWLDEGAPGYLRREPKRTAETTAHQVTAECVEHDCACQRPSLEAAWAKYGRHLPDCQRYGMHQCTCGFVETCSALKSSG